MDPRKGIGRLETQKSDNIKQPPREKINDDTQTRVLLRAFANGSELQNQLGHHLMLNEFWVESFSDMKREIRDYLGLKTAALDQLK